MTERSTSVPGRVRAGGLLLLVVLAITLLGPGPVAAAGATAAGPHRRSPAAPPWAGRSGHVTAVAGRRGAAPGPRTYRPPVVAPITDPFRPPPQPWLPGNRGIEYGTTPGTLVRAIGPGRVSFAGPVAGALHVTITHPDGLRSSYSFLAAVRVGEGQVVAAGEVVAVAGARFHLGVRRGDAYLDPASLWGRTVGGGRVVLVPIDGGTGRPPASPGG